MAGGRLRIWRFDGRTLRGWAQEAPGWSPPLPPAEGPLSTPEGPGWLAAVPDAEGVWLEFTGPPDAQEKLRQLRQVAGFLLAVERDAVLVSEELANRYEEIDLLYAISEILGHTVRLEEAGQTIIREVSSVVGARRGSIMVFEEELGMLKTIASRGFEYADLEPVAPSDPVSVAARAWRENRVIVHDPRHPSPAAAGLSPGRGYRGEAYASVPIMYAAPGTDQRCIGVINLTDRLGEDAFSPRDVKLITAIANQVGAAIENSRLVLRDRRQQRLERELELAHRLQVRLLPSPAVLQGVAQVATRFRPAESVGGDFYTFTRLPGGRVGVMLGDVSSHGFPAALVMALVMSAAGIHAAASLAPDETLDLLLDSLADDLASTDMYLSVFYGVIDSASRQLHYANAGHPHAFRIPASGRPERLETTAPPLGLASAGSIGRRTIPWAPGADLLCLWTDGLVDARNELGAPFGEARLLDVLAARAGRPVDDIVQEAFAEADAFSPEPADDRTLLVLRM